MIDAVLNQLRNLTKHQNVALINRANAAILLSILQSSGPILIPKEGTWLTYQKFALALNRQLIKVETKDANINLEDLATKVSNAKKSCQNHEQPIFIYHSNAAYTMAQDTKQIYQICHSHHCLVAMDVSGAIGTELSNGHHADIIFASFGKWKLIDSGVGAFISTADKTLFEKIKPLFSAFTFDGDYSLLHQKIKNLPKRIAYLQGKSKQIFSELNKFDLINSDQKYPFVVLVKFKNEIERLKIAAYCTKQKIEYTLCPREIRVMIGAISIEVKRLEN